MDYNELIKLYTSIDEEICKLHGVQLRKIEAQNHHDLDKLNDCIKLEQAISLAMRGYEQKRLTIHTELGVADVPLSELSTHFPQDIAPQMSTVADKLLTNYSALSKVQDTARKLIEANLKLVENSLEYRGVVLEVDKEDVATPNRPPALRTSIKA